MQLLLHEAEIEHHIFFFKIVYKEYLLLIKLCVCIVFIWGIFRYDP